MSGQIKSAYHLLPFMPPAERAPVEADAPTIAFRVVAVQRQQRAHQQPRRGRQIQVRPNPQTGPDTRQATESIGE